MGFLIFKISWLTQRKGNEVRREEVIKPLWIIIDFLQKNQLTKEKIANSISEMNDDFYLDSDHLTDLGLEVMKKSFDKWLTKVDEGMPYDDVTILQKTLSKVREKYEK